MDTISYQLYSSREHKPFEDTLKMLKEAGYGEVEGYLAQYDEPEAKADMVWEAGLVMPTGHFPLEMLEGDFQTCIDVAAAFGMVTIFCPYLNEDQRPTDAAGWQRIGGRLAEIRKQANDAGLGFGWHNHDFEVVPLPDGSLPLNHILDADEDLRWEADLAWVARGGHDPIKLIRRHQDRITDVHVKDIAPTGECADEDGWADVGKGTMDWPALLAALEDSPVAHYILEHDKPSDDARFAKDSAAYLRGLLQ